MALPFRTTPGLPAAIKPLGIHTDDTGTRRNIVMVNNVPYYQSSGNSNTPGFGHKESGSWWPFSGIEPQGSKWADHASYPQHGLPNNWFMKGPDFSKHLSGAHAMDWSTNKPNQINTILQSYNEQLNNHNWHEFEGSKQVNDSLIANGWDVPMRGEYPQPQEQTQEQPQEQPPKDSLQAQGSSFQNPQEQPPKDSLLAQGSSFQNGVAMNLAWRLLKRQTELGEHHKDFPSSHGPVKWYHGTPMDISHRLLKARQTVRVVNRHPNTDMVDSTKW